MSLLLTVQIKNLLKYGNMVIPGRLNTSGFKTYVDGEVFNYANMEITVKELRQLTGKTKVTWDTIVVTPIEINS